MENSKAWIQEWYNLWPVDVKFNGFPIKSNFDLCVNKMQKFCEKHKTLTKQIIFAATNIYLAQQKAVNWEYTRRAHFFIDKQGHGSLLEQYCFNEQTKILNPQAQETEDFLKNFHNDFI